MEPLDHRACTPLNENSPVAANNVIFRLRPPTDAKRAGAESVHINKDKLAVGVVAPGGGSAAMTEFDFGFCEEDGNATVCEVLGGCIVAELLEGFSQTLLAYGQTGAGKTYTMDALTRHGLERLFAEIEYETSSQDPRRVMTYSASCSYLEVYDTAVYDLLDTAAPNGPRRKLAVRGTAEAYYVDQLSRHDVSSAQEALELFARGGQRRHTARTAMNECSSRSHAIFQVHLRMEKYKPREGTTTRTVAVLNLVDLAGSERQNKSGSAGQTLQEARFINKSLTHLSVDINRLLEHAPHVPYSSSNLIKLLKESLGGTARTTMIVALSPDHANAQETAQTIAFGRRVRGVQNMPTVTKLTVQAPSSGVARRNSFGPGRATPPPPFGSVFGSPSSDAPTPDQNTPPPGPPGLAAAAELGAQLAAALRREQELLAQVGAAQESIAELKARLEAAEQRERQRERESEAAADREALAAGKWAAEERAALLGALLEAAGAERQRLNSLLSASTTQISALRDQLEGASEAVGEACAARAAAERRAAELEAQLARAREEGAAKARRLESLGHTMEVMMQLQKEMAKTMAGSSTLGKSGSTAS